MGWGDWAPDVDSAITGAASAHGVDLDTMRAFARIESGGDPRNRTGSYRGLYQLSPTEFAKHGGQGDIYDPQANANAAALKIKAHSADFERKYGRQPTGAELYLIHQQGEGGAAAHWASPDQPAWMSMYSTGEGRQKGAEWAKRAIWGNVPSDVRRQYGSVDNITSRDFVDLWKSKFSRLGGPDRPAVAGNTPGVVAASGAADTGAVAAAGAFQERGKRMDDTGGEGGGIVPWMSKNWAALTNAVNKPMRDQYAGADGTLQGVPEDAQSFLKRYPSLNKPGMSEFIPPMLDVYRMGRDLNRSALREDIPDKPATWGQGIGAALQALGGTIHSGRTGNTQLLMAPTIVNDWNAANQLREKLGLQAAMQQAQGLSTNADALLKQFWASEEKKRDRNAVAKMEGLPSPYPDVSPRGGVSGSPAGPVPSVATPSAAGGMAQTQAAPPSGASAAGVQPVQPVDRTQATYKTPAQEAGARARTYAAMGPEFKALADYWKEKETQHTDAERKAAATQAESEAKDGVERFNKIQESSTMAATHNADLDVFEQAMAKMPTGPAAQRLLPVAKWASDLGLNPGFLRKMGYKDEESISAAQLMESLASRATLASGQAMKGSFSDKDIAFLKGIGVSLANTTGGNKMLIDYMRANNELAMNLGEAARVYKSKRGRLDDGWHEIAQQIYNQSPVAKMAADWKAKSEADKQAKASPDKAASVPPSTSAPTASVSATPAHAEGVGATRETPQGLYVKDAANRWVLFNPAEQHRKALMDKLRGVTP